MASGEISKAPTETPTWAVPSLAGITARRMLKLASAPLLGGNVSCGAMSRGLTTTRLQPLLGRFLDDLGGHIQWAFST